MIVKKIAKRLEENANKHKLNVFIGIINTIRASLDDKRLTLVYFDGEDWAYRWLGGSLFLDSPKACPRTRLEQDLPIFGWHHPPQEGNVAVDIGAGVGTEIPWLSKSVGPSGVVVAIEADPIATRRLKKLVQANALRNVITVQTAVWSHSTILNWDHAPNEGLRSKASRDFSDGQKVTATELSSILMELKINHVDYVKMNIEGAEREALQGMNLNRVHVDFWCISCHDFMGSKTQTVKFVENWLDENGYELLKNPFEDPNSCEGHYRYAILELTKD